MLRVFAVVLLSALPPMAGAQVFKCTDASGKTEYRQTQCDSTAKNEQVIKPVVTKGFSGRTGHEHVDPDPELSGPKEAAELIDLYRRWTDAEKVARATARVSLAGPAAAIQALRREAENRPVPKCLDASRKRLVELITESEKAILEFMLHDGGFGYEIVYRRRLIPAFEHEVHYARCG